ncbi:MAG TPA: helix-hairpin-helix domain-containing protein [Flavisolibacter sp.]
MKKLLLLYCFSLPLSLAAQEVPASTQQQLENLGDESLEDDALLQQLDFFRKHPLNLNTATAEELQPVRFLTGLQIANFIRYRNLFGKLIDIYELQAVPGFDVATIQKIRPFVYVGPAVAVKEAFLSRFKSGGHDLLFRYTRILEKSKGYDTSLTTHYLGDPSRLLFRYRYQYKNLLYYGLLADKDAGEQFFKGAQKQGFDFYSAHLFVRNIGKLKALALGDYTVNLGQGLTQWQSLGFGKSVDVINSKRQSPVLLPYRSAGEFYFNRGVGVTLGVKDWEATAFFSYKKFSGNLAFDSTSHFTSFGTSGYYRTRNEIADRYKLTDVSFGGNLSYHTGNLQAGLNAVVHQFSLPIEKRNEPYNYFALSGRRVLNTSFDYSYTYTNMHLFGEIAVDKNASMAVVQGLLISLDKKIDVSLLYRNISKGYQSPFGNAFTENSLPGNEKGMFAGVLFRPAVGWQVACYADIYQFPFLKYRVSAPSKGSDYLLQVTLVPSKRAEVYLRYRTENKPVNGSGPEPVIQFPADKIKQNLRFHFVYQWNAGFTIKGRTEMIWFDKKGANKAEGFLTFIETSQSFGKLKGNFRLQYFETDSYDSRIYAYESDVLNSFSIPVFYDKGLRYYMNLNFPILPQLHCWVRFAQTAYLQKHSIGSGLDEIRGNKRTEFRLQIMREF